MRKDAPEPIAERARAPSRGLAISSSVPLRRALNALAGLVCAASLVTAGAAERQTLKGHVPAAVRHLQPRERLSATNRLDLVFGLPLRNPDALDRLLRDLYDPASPRFQRYLTPAEFAEQFGPTPADYAAVVAFAKANGFRVTATHPNRTLLDVSGKVGDIEKALGVRLHVYQHPAEQRTFYAPDAEPSLDLSVPLLMVSGLDNFSLPRPAGLRLIPLDQSAGPLGNVAGSGPRGFLMGRDFRAAYVPGVPLDGAGQVVGLMEMDGYYTNDVLAYENLAGLPNVPITNILVNGFSGRPGGQNGEVALDIDMVLCMAPGLSRLILYSTSNTGSPYDVLNRMANDTNGLGQVVARQLSSSWSWTNVSTIAQNQVFQQFVAQGQSFFQASGDDGAYCGASCPPPTPNENPNVTVVGGTSLSTTSPGGAWASESVWPGSGGGFGTNYALPAWQQGLDMTRNGGSSTMRNIPDVACVADAIWIIAENGQQFNTGGTSAAAPLWAGLAALVNQQAAANGQPMIGFINPALYAIGKSSRYASAFHDITAGNNTSSCCGTNFSAGPGYDLCTGWGTPIGSNLISALLTPPVPLTITPVAPLTFTGPLGGPFHPASQGFVLTNNTSVPFNWTLTKSGSWLSASPANGSLTNGGPAAVVNLILTAAASSLSVGSYTNTLWFTNLSDMSGQSRWVVLDVVAPPVIATQPSSQSVLEGSPVSFTVTLSNSASCTYQWQYDNGTYVTNLTDGDGVTGSRSPTLTIASAVPSNAGGYSVVVSNAAGTVTSAQALLGILPWRPVITAQPTNLSVLEGQTASFTVAAVGKEPLFYLWQRNGSPLSDTGNISGSSSNTLTLRSATAADAGTYSITVGNGDGLASSSGAVLTVTGITAPATALTTVYSFTGGGDGANPNGLLRTPNGSFFGTAQNGGTGFSGTVFQLSPSGEVLALYAFTDGTDGATPLAPLTLGPDGNYYGTTYQGGAYDNGTVFSMTPSGVVSNLISLNITNGSFPYAGLVVGPDGNLYGTTYQGGRGRTDYVFRPGEVFKVSTDGVLTLVYSFTNGVDGGFPAAGVVRGGDGNFYGATSQGGVSGYGTVFSLTPSGLLTTLVTFNKANGAMPLAELVQDPTGVFYGTTAAGGAYNYGTLFRMTSKGMLPNPYSFTGGSDGGYPAAALLLGSDGNFYGTTAYGGDYGDGTLFRLTPDGVLTTLVQFDGYAGANPQAALVQDTDGSLLGTAQNGGASDVGVIFRVSFSGAPQITSQPAGQTVFAGQTVLFSVAAIGAGPLSFQWSKDGQQIADGGNLSGTSSRVLILTNVTTGDTGTYSVRISNSAGATNSAGAFLQVISSPPVIVASPTNLAPNACTRVSFNVEAIGNQPLGYQWQKNGVNLTDTCSLSGSTSASLVLSSVTEADNGTYTVVVINSAGSTNVSAVLALVPKTGACTSLTTRHWFSGGADGRLASGLAQGTNGVLYGTTSYGGYGPWGTVFSLTTNGTFTTLVSFMETNGANPTAPPVQGPDGRFYGTTHFGGSGSAGTVFAMTAEGVLSTLYAFTGDINGAWPAGPLALGADGNLYGTTTAGGISDWGTVFRMTPAGVITNLYCFTGGVDGQQPTGGLVQGPDGSFYGVTATGGTQFKGNVFRISPAGAFATIYSFTGGGDGSSPAGTLALGSDGDFYGTANTGGLGHRGTVFKLTPAGALMTLYSFGNFGVLDGVNPAAGVVQSSDGNLYGTTPYNNSISGPTGYGTLFRVSPDGSSFVTLLFFDGCDDGAQPQTALMEDALGDLYGSTSSGGPCQANRGTLFRLGMGCPPQITAQPASQVALVGANVQFSVAVTGARPFTYQWQRNNTNLLDHGNVSGSTNRCLNLTGVSLADGGTYSVTVSNALGRLPSTAAHLTIIYPPVFLSAVRSNCTLALTYSTIPGQKYRVQYKPSLGTSTWTGLGPSVFPAGYSITAYDNSCTNTQRFYRIMLTPQIQ